VLAQAKKPKPASKPQPTQRSGNIKPTQINKPPPSTAGAMEGDQEFDYDWLKRDWFIGYKLAPDDEQFPKGKWAYRSFSHLDRIQFTDERSCLLDTLNMAINRRPPLTRADLELTAGAGFKLGHPNVVTALKTAGIVLQCVKGTTSSSNGKTNPPSLEQVLKQESGVWIVQFRWDRTKSCGSIESVDHAVAVNCDLRLVFCNTLGALPFTLAEEQGKLKQGETAKTHKRVAARLGLRAVRSVWQVLHS
jgi:hypothetical protein